MNMCISKLLPKRAKRRIFHDHGISSIASTAIREKSLKVPWNPNIIDTIITIIAFVIIDLVDLPTSDPDFPYPPEWYS